jgi:hypothetical protein
MPMEDAVVLAEILWSANSIESALDAYIERGRPRVGWVRQQSRAVGESLGLPAGIHNGALPEHGAKIFRQRFAPLLAAP